MTLIFNFRSIGAILITSDTPLTLSFAPDSPGPHTSSLTLTTNSKSESSIRVTLQGEGVTAALTVTPNPFEFGNVQLDTLANGTLLITNNSALPETLGLTPLSGSVAFGVGALASTTVSGNGSTTLAVTYSPLLASSVAEATFGIALCTGCAPAVTVTLTGTGVTSVLSTNFPVEFGFVQPDGGTVTRSIKLTNIDQQPLRVDALALDPGPSTPAPYALAAAAPLPDTPTAFPFTLGWRTDGRVPHHFHSKRHQPISGDCHGALEAGGPSTAGQRRSRRVRRWRSHRLPADRGRLRTYRGGTGRLCGASEAPI